MLYPLSRLYGGPQRTCGRCHTEITCTDLVMKARHCVFHVDCFKCFECNSSLRKGAADGKSFQDNISSLCSGDLFGMFEDVLYCRLHFEMMTNYGPNDSLDCCPPPPLHSPSGASPSTHSLFLFSTNLPSMLSFTRRAVSRSAAPRHVVPRPSPWLPRPPGPLALWPCPRLRPRPPRLPVQQQ